MIEMLNHDVPTFSRAIAKSSFGILIFGHLKYREEDVYYNVLSVSGEVK